MQWNWASSIDELWRSPALPMWATLAAAAFSAIVVLVVLIRADKTMANGALAVITLLSIGIASTLAVRGFSTSIRPVEASSEMRPVVHQVASLPALACLDGLAGESVEAACEKAVFGSADAAAAAVSYTAAQMSRLANAIGARALNAEQQTLRSTLERDRFGLVAQVLTVRDKCTASDCGMFRMVSNASAIRNNMNERLYDTLILRHATSWNAAPSDTQPPVAGLFGNMPTGKPSTVEFPTASSTPPVNIMTAEPPAAAAVPPASPRPPSASTSAQAPAKANAAPKKQTQAAPKSAPTQLAPQATPPQTPSRSLYVPPQ